MMQLYILIKIEIMTGIGLESSMVKAPHPAGALWQSNTGLVVILLLLMGQEQNG